MSPKLILFALRLLLTTSFTLEVDPVEPRIIVEGRVYCDACINNASSKQDYFIPGAGVRIDCEFRAAWPRTAEEVKFTVNRTTNRFGVYTMNVPTVDGVECAEGAMVASCQASLLQNPSSSCNVPGNRNTTNEMIFKSAGPNVCIYYLKPLNFRPSNRNVHLCGK